MRRVLGCGVFLVGCLTVGVAVAQHNPGQNCLMCHAGAKVAGTIYTDETGTTTLPGAAITLLAPDGQVIDLGVSNWAGNIRSCRRGPVGNPAPDLPIEMLRTIG